MILPSTYNLPKSLLATAALALATLTGPVTAETVVILSEDWQTSGMVSGDISNATNAPLTGWAGFGLNNDNPTMLLVPSGGNVLRDQAGFGGNYGSADNAGNAARVRSSNGAMLNEDPLQLDTLAATSVTFSFDLKQVTANYVQVVEFSNNIGFLASGGSNTVVRLDTIDGLGTLGLWEAKSYTLVDGVDASFTDASYFRIRKLRPNPAGTTAGANSTFHVYDNLVITAEVPPSAPESFQLIIAPNGPNFDFTWDSKPGKVYDLVSSTDPATPILIWPVYDPDGPGGNDPFSGIPPTGATTLLMAVPGDGPKRFFAMIERDGAAPSN